MYWKLHAIFTLNHIELLKYSKKKRINKTIFTINVFMWTNYKGHEHFYLCKFLYLFFSFLIYKIINFKNFCVNYLLESKLGTFYVYSFYHNIQLELLEVELESLMIVIIVVPKNVSNTFHNREVSMCLEIFLNAC